MTILLNEKLEKLASLKEKQNHGITNTAPTPPRTGDGMSHIIFSCGITMASRLREPSVETTPPQVICYDDIGDGVKDKLDVVGVRSTGHVGVHLLVGRLVLALVLTLDVGYSL